MRVTADRLQGVASAILKSGGSAGPEADLVADHLVQANLAGHDSHGVRMIPAYVRDVQAGRVVPNMRVALLKDDGPILMFDGGRGYGRCVAGEAMAAAIGRCRDTGVVAMTLANAHRALLHQPGLHRPARHRPAAAATPRHGDERDRHG